MATSPTVIRPQSFKPCPPKISITIPAAQYQSGVIPSPAHLSTHSNPSVIGAPPPPGAGESYVNPFNYMYSGGEYVFKQFEDIVVSSAKSGLNFGERVAFYIYEKFSKWSKKWFTHFFLFIVIFLYSLIGAVIFVAVEGQCYNKLNWFSSFFF